MKIDISKIPGSYDGKECYVHARAGTIGGNKLIMTMQKLNVSGSDLFLPPVLLKSDDGGRTWTEPKPIAEATYTDDGTAHLCCDSTHLLQKKPARQSFADIRSRINPAVLPLFSVTAAAPVILLMI